MKAAVGSAVASGGATWTSFFVATLPVVQWGAAAVAIVAGLVTVAIGAIKLRQWWKARS